MHRLIRKGLVAVVCVLASVGAVPAHADGLRDDPLARFSDALCPGVHGLSAEAASVIVSRIRNNARDLGLDLAPQTTCKPNLYVAFLDDGQAYLERIDRETKRLAQLTTPQRRALLNQPGPVRSWVTVAEKTLDGQPVGIRENLVEIPRAQAWSAHSRIYVPTRRDIVSAIVLIDRVAAEGMTFGQMADLATLYGLTDTVPAAARTTPSIQHLFGDGSGVEALSSFDLAFLQRLYTLPPNLPAAAYVAGLPGVARTRD